MSISADFLVQILKTNRYVIREQAKDVTHEESVMQPHDPVNTFNWVLGHIVQNRDEILKALGLEPQLTPEETALYQYGSEPIHGDAAAIKFERLLELFYAAHDALVTQFEAMSPDDFDKLHDKTTLGLHVHWLLWHETYHIGQTEYTRQITGKADKVI